jgi:uncharacterized protein (TIGR04255 family)
MSLVASDSRNSRSEESTIHPFPNYQKPPVIEVAAGVQFEELQGWQMRYFGQFWSEIAAEYPITQDQAPVPDVLETGPRLEILTIPPLRRMLLFSQEQNYVIQLQESRLHFNWRKVRESDEYPRFEKNIFPQFLDLWGRFSNFATRMALGNLRPQRYELTYVNHIEPKGDHFAEALENRVKLFSWSSVKDGAKFLTAPTAANTVWTFSLPDQRGTGQATLNQATRADGRNVLVLAMSCGGPATARCSLNDWFATAHEWIVRGFADLTTASAQAEWGRIK